MNPIYITLGIIILIAIIFISIYNSLSRKRNQIENAISATDSLFIKRSDLIPNLISMAQQYMEFEKETLEKIVALRNMNIKTNPDDETLSKQALSKIMVQAEQYPDLKTGEQFIHLQLSLNEVEEQISAGRRYISSSITDYNNTICVFPNNIIAAITGFKKYNWQYANNTQRENISAKELFKQ